jgi:hypothetical protein
MNPDEIKKQQAEAIEGIAAAEALLKATDDPDTRRLADDTKLALEGQLRILADEQANPVE